MAWRTLAAVCSSFPFHSPSSLGSSVFPNRWRKWPLQLREPHQQPSHLPCSCRCFSLVSPPLFKAAGGQHLLFFSTSPGSLYREGKKAFTCISPTQQGQQSPAILQSPGRSSLGQQGWMWSSLIHHPAELSALLNGAEGKHTKWRAWIEQAATPGGRINSAAAKGSFIWVQTTPVTQSLQKEELCETTMHVTHSQSQSPSHPRTGCCHHQNLFSLQAFNVTNTFLPNSSCSLGIKSTVFSSGVCFVFLF